MSSKPKKSEYQASESEKASAAVAMAEHQYFQQRYAPLLRQMRDNTASDDGIRSLRARANADTMQTLTATPSYAQTQALDLAGDMSAAYQGQLGTATQAGKAQQVKEKLDVLGTARGQQATGSQAMSNASNIATSNLLSKAADKQTVRQARQNAMATVGSELLVQGAKNKAGGGDFFTPNMNAGQMEIVDGKAVPMKTRLASGFGERFAASAARTRGGI